MEELLSGIKVLDLTADVAGNVAAAMMTDYGAEVIKIERPGIGDPNRKAYPVVEGGSLTNCWVNRGKKSVELDITDPEGAEIVKKIAASVDIVFESGKPGELDRYGLGYKQLEEINPGIIYCSVTPFGQKGPYVQHDGYDNIAQAMSGYISQNGMPDGPMMQTGMQLSYYLTAYASYAAALMALYYRQETGIGQHVDTNLDHTMIFMNSATERLYQQNIARRAGNKHNVLCPYGVFFGNNGQSCMIAAANQSTWVRVCRAMERPDMITDPRFETVAARGIHQNELNSEIEKWLKSFDDISEPCARMDRENVPSCPVYSNEDVKNSEQILANKIITELEVSDEITDRKTFLTRNVSTIYSETPGKLHKADSLGQHSREVLSRYMSQQDVDKLLEKQKNKIGKQ